MSNKQERQEVALGAVSAGFVLTCLLVYGVVTGFPMMFILWLAALLVVLALGNKAIR